VSCLPLSGAYYQATTIKNKSNRPLEIILLLAYLPYPYYEVFKQCENVTPLQINENQLGMYHCTTIKGKDRSFRLVSGQLLLNIF
jgi:hypothetical protein